MSLSSVSVEWGKSGRLHDATDLGRAVNERVMHGTMVQFSPRYLIGNIIPISDAACGGGGAALLSRTHNLRSTRCPRERNGDVSLH